MGAVGALCTETVTPTFPQRLPSGATKAYGTRTARAKALPARDSAGTAELRAHESQDDQPREASQGDEPACRLGGEVERREQVGDGDSECGCGQGRRERSV